MLKTKRLFSIVLAFLMCISMLTGIVLPASAAEEKAADPYAKINATDNGDGTWTPGKAVFVYAGAPASGDTTYKYGDGTTWGNGKTYKLVGGVTAFSKMNAAIHYIESQWNAHTGPYSTYTGPDTVVVAPGNYAGSSWQNNITVKFNLPKDDEGNTIENPAYYELFTYTVLGPQAGKDPTPKTKDAIANGTLSNGRSFDTSKEAVSTSTLWMPQNAQLIIDGWAFRGSHNFHGSSSLVSLVMHNVVYRYDTRYANGLYRYDSPNNNINIEFHNYTVEYTQIATASVQDDLAFNMEVTRLVFDNYYEYGGNLDFVSDANYQAHMINFYPTTSAKIKPNFLGEGNTTAEFIMTNSTLSHNRTAHWIRTRMGNTTTTKDGVTTTTRDYAANTANSVRFTVKDNHFYNAGDWCGTDYVKVDDTVTYDGVGDGDRAAVIDVFSFQDAWSIPAGALEFRFEGNTIEYTADCLARHKSGSQNGFVLIKDSNDVTKQNFYFKDTTMILPEHNCTDAISLSESGLKMDRSSMLVLNDKGEVMAAGMKDNQDHINDVYAGDDFQGGIVEMFTVKTATDMAFNGSVTAANTGSRAPVPAVAQLVIVPYATEESHPVENLFTFRGNKVEFVGIYDKNGKAITSAKPSELDGCTMVATYKGKTTTCNVTYTIKVATESDMVFLDATNSATSYTFNGKTYTLNGDNRVATFQNAFAKNKPFVVALPGTYKFVGGNTDRVYNTRFTILGPKMGISPLNDNNDIDFSNRAITGNAAPYTIDTTKEAVIGGAVTNYGAQNRLMMDGVVLDNTFQFSPSMSADAAGWGLATGGSLIGQDLNNVVVNDVINNNLIVGLSSGNTLKVAKPKGYFNANNTAFCNVGGGCIVSSGMYDINLDHIYASGGNGELIRTRMPSGSEQEMSPMECGLAITNSKIENWGTTGGNWIYTNYVDSTLESWGLSAYCNGENFPAGVHQIFENNTFVNIGKSGCQTKGYALRLGIPYGMDNAKIIFKNNTVLEDELCTYRFIDTCSTGKNGGAYLKNGNVDVSGNVFVNFSEPFRLGQSAAAEACATFNIDENYYGIIENGKEVVKPITAKTRVAKSDWYYLDRAMTTKSSEVQLDDTKNVSVDNDKFDGINHAAVSIDSAEMTVEKAFKAVSGAEIVGVYKDAACTQAVTGTLSKEAQTLYVLIKKTATGIGCVTEAKVDFSNVWEKNGLAPVGEETFVDLTTQAKYHERVGGRPFNMIFIAPDWSDYAYFDEDLKQPVKGDTSIWETEADLKDNDNPNTPFDENTQNFCEMAAGTEFYAKMPTTGIVYKLTYGVTAANLYNADTSRASTIVAFPGEYTNGSAYNSQTLYNDNGTGNGQVGIGTPWLQEADYSSILFLGPQAGVSAADTVNGTANGRSLDPKTEAIFNGRGFYIMNNVLGDGDEFIIDGIAGTNGINFYDIYGNANFTDNKNNEVTFTFKNNLFDKYTGALFNFRSEKSSVGTKPANNKAKISTKINLEGCYLNCVATGWQFLGYAQADSIQIDNSVLLNNTVDHTKSDSTGFYINPTTGTNFPKKIKLSYVCENSYISSDSYIFGIYFNGTENLNSTTREGIEVRFENNTMVDCGIDAPGGNDSRDPLYIAFSPTAENQALIDFIFKNNTITATTYPVDDIDGNLIQTSNGNLRSVDISGNVITGYGVTTKIIYGMNNTVDVSDNAFFDIDGNPISPKLGTVSQKTDVVLNKEFTAFLSDFNIKSGASQNGKLTWSNDATNVYTDAQKSATANIEHTAGMTVDTVKNAIKFNSDNVTVTAVTDNNGGEIAINDVLTVTATHALTGKSINYSVAVTGLLDGATRLEDTKYDGRNYYDPAVKDMLYGQVVARAVYIDGVETLVQFTVGENVFGNFNDIPVINKKRDIYLFAQSYAAIGFGAADERNVMNYLHGANEGITGVADTNGDGVPDAKNPARTDKSKETVLTGCISCGYHADVTVDGVTMDPGFYISNSSGNWGTGLATNNIKLLNSVTDTVLLQNRGASDQIIGAKGTHRLNVEVGNTYIVCSDESLGGNIITVRSPEHVNLYNNVLKTGAKMGVLYYAPVQSWGKTDTFAYRHEVDIVGNYMDSGFSLVELPTTSKLSIDVNITGNLFELCKDSTSINVGGMYTDANTYLDASKSKFVIEGNTFTAKPNVYTGSYISFGASSNAEDLTVVLKDNTFVRGSNFGANYAISNYGKMTFDASDNNVFDGFKYNTGDHNYIAPMIFRNTGASVILSKGEATSYVKYNGKTYAVNVASDTFGIADLFSDKAIVDTDAKTVREYVIGATTNKYIFNVDEGMNVKATIGDKTYYNAIPLTNGTGTATVQLTKINGEAVGEAYTVTFVVYCDHTTCFQGVTPDKKVDATCSDGYADYTCPVNGEKFTVIFQGDGQHVYDAGVVTTAPTCKTTGIKLFTCTRCPVDERVTVASYEEVMDIVACKAADDAEWDIILKENCKDDGEQVKYCQWCNEICEREVRKSTGEHNFVPTVKTPATCTTEGIMNYYCDGCKVSHDEAIPVLGHDYKAETTKEPTCIEDGIMTYTCANCNDSYTEAIKANGRHVYESKVTTEPTCHSTGVMTYECANCDDSYTEVIPATGAHDLKAVVTIAETCTTDGLMTYTCQNDGCTHTYTEVIPNLGGHEWSPWMLGDESSCVEHGYDYRTCSVCGAEETRERAFVDHVWDNEYTIDVKPTGSVAGIKSRHCLVCKDARTDITNIGYCQHEHYTGEQIVTREPYCLEPGLIVDICADCGDQCNEQNIPVLPHDLYDVEVVVEGDCTTDRVVAQKCTLCQQIYNRVETAPGHNAGVWKTTIKPTCTTEGTAEQRCTVCDALLDTRAVAATNHANGYTWITTTEATCDSEGEQSYTCVDCGHVATTKTIAAKGHQDTHVDTVPATCTEDGLRTYECLICGLPLEDQVIPATGHKAGKWQTVKPATTEAAGLKVKKCTVCGVVVEEQAIEQIIIDGACHPFTDVSNKAWYHKAVDFVYGSGMMNGTSANKFSPELSTTRGMFVTILGRLSGIDADKYTFAYFEDVKEGSYYFGYIEWARVNGIVNGTGNYVFQPDRAINRQEMCKIIVSYADYAEITLEKKNGKVTFKDDAKIASWAKSYVYAAQRAGIVSGDAAGTFRPTDTAKRCEVATLIMNFYNNYVK